LESRFPVLDLDALVSERTTDPGAPPGFVAVLGAGERRPRPGLSAVAQLQPTGVVRLAEAVRILRRLPDARLVACTFSHISALPSSPVAVAARDLGVEHPALVTSIDRPSTRSELEALKKVVASDRFILVTSAAHMPRAVRLCETLGLHPLPAPTDFLARRGTRLGLSTFAPTTQSIIQCERALREYLAAARDKWTG
jgi:uncharacterized SAM-binding protein YcdF (DUF218 family)